MSWIDFDANYEFYKNTTEGPVKLTITVKNKEEFDMTVYRTKSDKSGSITNMGTVVTVPAGKCKTFTVEVPAGQGLAADQAGSFMIH